MGKSSSISDLFDVPEDTEDEQERMRTMQRTEEGNLLLREHGVRKYHSALGFLGRFSAKGKASFRESKDGISIAWAAYRQSMQQRSDEAFANFRGDYQDDLARATECLKLAYSMTKQMLGIAENRASYRGTHATLDMALHPKPYNRAIDAGVKHLKEINQVLALYVHEKSHHLH